MNIDEYRAFKAQQEQESAGGAGDVQVEQTTATMPEQNIQETGQVQPTPEQAQIQETVHDEPETPQIPSTIKVGDAEYSVDELIQARTEAETLRQQQAAAAAQLEQAAIAQQYYSKMMENPEYAQAFAQNNGLTYIDPKEQAVQELQQRYDQMLLEREIDNMKLKYQDFDPQEVVKFAVDRQINNLEDAYLLNKARTGSLQQKESIDKDAIAEQIRQEVLAELKSEVNTGSLIGGGGSGKVVQDDTPQLSATEIRVAQGLGMTPLEYAKWKNAK